MKEKRFFETDLFIFALLFIFPPLGILALWIIKSYHIYLRITLTILFGLLFLNYLGLETSFIRAVLVVLVINLLWLRNQYINNHKQIAQVKFQELQGHFEFQAILKNYLKQYDPPTNNYYYIKYFEDDLIKEHPMMSLKFSISNPEEIYIKMVFKKLAELKQKIDIDTNVLNKHKTNFLMLVKVVTKMTKLGPEKLVIYYVWTLLKEISIDYYADEFIKAYGESFKGIEKKDMVKAYLSNVKLSKDLNSKERILFTYYLMKGDQSHDFVAYSNVIESEFQKQLKLNEEKAFELSLINK